MKKTPAIAAVLLIAAAVPTIGAGAAHAGDRGVIRHGSCSGSTDWKMKAKPDNGRIEVESEIDSNRNGQTWAWTLQHDGDVAAHGRSTTRGPSGSFEVSRRTGNSAGSDSFTFRAENARSGEVCVARVRL
ncbi:MULTISPECIES: hypothetical protein [unclassified Nocardioides]|uniref:hypothetical protein n=1 Tax=unclassified Nocardioides TaxID=2615069 RepID=UPI0010544997|nr:MULTISPECIES: hypothetical protein [unclassified Nocardioides]